MLLRIVVAALILYAAAGQAGAQTPSAPQPAAGVTLPEPFATPSARNSPRGIGWPEGKTPAAPAGFTVNAFARGVNDARWMYVLPNGDVLVAQAGAFGGRRGPRRQNQILLLRDADGDGEAEVREVFLSGLNRPHGMALVGDTFYVANTDGVFTYPYQTGQTRIEGAGEKIVDLPAGGYNNHWTRGLLLSRDKRKMHVAVGSASNVGEGGMEIEQLRANILTMNLDGSDLKVFASGLRNPVGMDFEPETGALWTAVNERDELGDDLVPDYLTSVRERGFYGWPYSYFGRHEDPRRKGERPDLVAKAIVPDLELGSHTASLGLVFYRGDAFPARYRGGAFVAQRGSWNRSTFVGYRVVFVPFAGGRPSGPVEDFLTGFIANEPEVYGRPVGVVVAPDGALLVTDEVGGVVWRVSADK
jgi:glucose/arabinose dehydrogenase